MKKKILDIFSSKKSKNKTVPYIIADHREKNSLIIAELIQLGCKVEFRHLKVADFIIGNIAIERKTISDFKNSIINKRIIQQLLELKQYPQHFLLLEGIEKENLYGGILYENAFRGFILSIINEYKVPLIFSLNEKDSASYIYVLAKKQRKSTPSIRASKITLSDKERIQYVLEGFPGIGPATAKILISHYKNLKNLFSTTKEELKSVIGKKAEELWKLINLEPRS